VSAGLSPFEKPQKAVPGAKSLKPLAPEAVAWSSAKLKQNRAKHFVLKVTTNTQHFLLNLGRQLYLQLIVFISGSFG
jgi:hypothetical protein